MMTQDLLRALDAPATADRTRIDFANGTLVGTRCSECSWVAWPPRAACARCLGTAVKPFSLPKQGTLRTWTRVWVPAEGIQPPYVLGLVRLGDVQVFAHIRELAADVTVPAEVGIEVSESSHPPFWFTQRSTDASQ